MKARLPILEDVRIASPCHESWDAMAGGERVRHCGSCDLDVFNLSGMTREEATELLHSRGASICARFYRRADGTVLTADCPVGVARLRRRLVLVATAVFSLLGLSGVVAAAGVRTLGCHGSAGGDVLGQSPTLQSVMAMFSGKPTPPPKVLMGKIAIPHPTATPVNGSGSTNGGTP